VNIKLAFGFASTMSRLCTVVLMPALFTACSDTDVEVIPTGQFDDGTYEIFGPPVNGVQPSLGVIFAHKAFKTLNDGTKEADFASSYESWAVDGTYCSSEIKDCSYQPLTFTYAGKMSFDEWTAFVNSKKFNNPRYYRATYVQHGAQNQGLLGCGSTQCEFLTDGNYVTPVSMFPLNKVLVMEGIGLPTVVVKLNGTNTTETWYMREFFNAENVPQTGVTFSKSVDVASVEAPVDCAACNAPIQVDVRYKPCTKQPTDESELGCIEKTSQ
jgi:hypothetical protein